MTTESFTDVDLATVDLATVDLTDLSYFQDGPPHELFARMRKAAGPHWNALTDGRWKYIFHARDAEEQLFDLHHDPHELSNLSGDTAHAEELRKWRSRLVEHFTERGEPFLSGGKLAIRVKSTPRSPLFPSIG